MFEAEHDIAALAEDMGVDMMSLGQLYGIFCLEMAGEITELRLHLESRSWEKLQRVAHNIKGISSNLHLDHIFRAAEALHLQLKEVRLQDIGKQVDQIEAAFLKTRTEIVAVFEKYNINIQIE